MTRKSAILHFEAALVEKPVLSGLIRNHDVTVNILQASISPDEAGTMFVQVEGEPGDVKRAFAYLGETGVRMVFPTKNLVWEEEKCTSCGACVAQCLPKALAVDEKTKRVSLADSLCIACELCIPACPFGALESVTEHLG